MGYSKKRKIRDERGRFVKGHPGNINLGKGQFKKGHPGYNKKSNSGSFKKGQPNINKGKNGFWGSNVGSFQKGNLPWIKGRFGEEASNWKGGRTPMLEAIRKSERYNRWRMNVFAKDNFACQFCETRGGSTRFEVHHTNSFINIVKGNNIKTIKQALKCKELWDVNNGTVLCNKCHNLTR